MHAMADREIDSTCASRIWHVGGNAPATRLVTGSLNMWMAGLWIHARSALAHAKRTVSRFEAFASFNSATHGFDPIAA